MARVTMVYGELGAGKTTYARGVEDSGAIRLSLDEWTIAATGDARSVSSEVVNRILDQLTGLWTQLVRSGLDVVLDCGFWDRARRDEVRSVAASLGAEVELVELRCDEEVRRARVTNRQVGDGNYLVDAASFDWIVANRNIDQLGPDETHIVVDTSGETPQQDKGRTSQATPL